MTEPKSRIGFVAVVLLAVSLGFNVFLGVRLNDVMESQAGPRTRTGKFTLEQGDSIPPLEVVKMDGRKVTYQFEGQKVATVIYVITPECGWCQRNENNFGTLLRERGRTYRFLVLSLTDKGLPEYIAKAKTHWGDVPVDVAYGLSDEMVSRLYLGGTPQTIMVSVAGKVMGSWVGAYTPTNPTMLSEVQAMFAVEMPGLLPEAPGTRSAARCINEADGLGYSLGAVLSIKGERKECGADGKWKPATR